MPAPDLGFALGLPPERAIRYFQSLGYATPANWREAQIAAGQQAFFVTGLYRQDVVEELRASLQAAINQGKSQREWREDVGNRMAQHGWLLDDGLMVDAKTGEQLAARFGEHRLNTIYRTNVKNAFAAGRWQEITRVQKVMPYLEYTAVMDDRTRDEHAVLDGHIYPIDDPFWQTFYPPNGFNCRCNVIQHSARDLDAMGRVAESSEGQWEDVEQLVGRDGDTVTTRGLKMPNGQVISADVGFDRNVGANYLDRLQQIAAEKHGAAFAERLAERAKLAGEAAGLRGVENLDALQQALDAVPRYGAARAEIAHNIRYKQDDLPTRGAALGLDEAQTLSIAIFTRVHGYINNLLLHGGAGLDYPQKLASAALVANMESALRKLPDYAGTVVRRTTAAEYNALFTGLDVGDVVYNPTFFSSSAGAEVFARYPVRLTLHCQHGKKIRNLSLLPQQEEVIFRPGTAWRILSGEIKTVNGKTEQWLTLQEI